MGDLLNKTEDFVKNLFQNKLPNTFIYHNLNHTERVVESSKEILENSEISVKDQGTVLLAAWLHDTGYTKTIKGHEDESVEIADKFLNDEGVDPDRIAKVKACILATKPENEPKNECEKIIRDADAAHLGKDYFEETTELLRQELKLNKVKNYKTSEWIQENIMMLTKKHTFYTAYAQREWKPQKDENLLKLLQKQKKLRKTFQKEKTKAKLKAKYKNDNPERSRQTLYRTVLRNHLKLSDIADSKANILLSVNAIVISLALANIIPKLDSASNRHLMIPTLILVCFSVASIVLSIMSTRPNVTSGEFTREQVKNRKVNILFFGNFHKMPIDQYKWAMDELLDNKEHVYDMLTMDLYYLGVVLHRKYKILRWTYTIFMTGIIISVISFVVAFSLI